MSSLYQRIKAAGIPTAHHESDLYFPASKEALAILKEFPLQRQNATRFVNQVEGGQWIDVPFAFDPFWESKARKSGGVK